MFQQPNCQQWAATEVNRFCLKKRAWEVRDFFIQKFNNFNGCELIALVFHPNKHAASEYLNFNFIGDQDEHLSGYAVDFNIMIARNLNYSLKMISVDMRLSKLLHESMTSESVVRFYFEILFWVTDYIMTTDDVILISRFQPYNQF